MNRRDFHAQVQLMLGLREESRRDGDEARKWEKNGKRKKKDILEEVKDETKIKLRSILS